CPPPPLPHPATEPASLPTSLCREGGMSRFHRIVYGHPIASLLLFWVLVPGAILAVAIIGQVQNQQSINRTQRLAESVDDRVTNVLCNLTESAWLERGRIMDGLVLATIRFVNQNPQQGNYQ